MSVSWGQRHWAASRLPSQSQYQLFQGLEAAVPGHLVTVVSWRAQAELQGTPAPQLGPSDPHTCSRHSHNKEACSRCPACALQPGPEHIHPPAVGQAAAGCGAAPAAQLGPCSAQLPSSELSSRCVAVSTAHGLGPHPPPCPFPPASLQPRSRASPTPPHPQVPSCTCSPRCCRSQAWGGRG